MSEVTAPAVASPSMMIPTGQRVVWSKTSGAFELQPALAPTSDDTKHKHAASSKANATFEQEMHALDEFARTGDASSLDAFDRFLVTRARATQQQTLASQREYAVTLRTLVAHWRAVLAHFSESLGIESAQHNSSSDSLRVLEALAREHLELACTLTRMGQIADARAILAKSIALVRRRQHFHDDTSDSSDTDQERATTATLLREATRALRVCIAFDDSLAKCQSLLQRHKTPPQIIAFLVRELEALGAQAPLSLEVLTIKTKVQWKARQFALIESSLAASPLTGESASLTLMHAQALERLGQYQQSLAVAVASDWCEPQCSVTPSDTDAGVLALLAHQQRLELLFTHKRIAEQQTRSEQFRDAAQSYTQCLAQLSNDVPAHCKFTAALLYARANVTLLALSSTPLTQAATTLAKSETASVRASRLATAIQDLRRSLELAPVHELARLRLDTALLQQATETLRRKLS